MATFEEVWHELLSLAEALPEGPGMAYYLFTGDYSQPAHWVPEGRYVRLYDAQKAGVSQQLLAPWKVINFRSGEQWECPHGHAVYYDEWSAWG